jgi:hypothetical protein
MADPSSEYWTGPEVDGGGTVLSRRYRELLAVESGELANPAADGWRASPAAARQSLDPALVNEWGDQFDQRLRRAQDVAALAAGGPEGMDFQTTFAGLSKTTQGTFFREIALPAPGYVTPATEGDMATFLLTDGGEQTIKTWGADAPRKVGQALDKFVRIEKSLPEANRDELAYVWRNITPRERQLVMFALGS